MFSKRPDKHTTGLINMRNDCFANASIQAFSALPGLTKYLNAFLKAYGNIHQIKDRYKVGFEEIISRDEIHDVLKSSSSRQRHDLGKDDSPIEDSFSITLHLSLAEMMRKLQDTQMSTRTISVWTFLHELERIYNAKISRSQHDAHELTQLITETLETENELCVTVSRNLRSILTKRGASRQDVSAIELPDFPFTGLLISRMKCLSCSHYSSPSITPFQMLTLHPPQTNATDLETLLYENETETISGYQCVKCRIRAIVEHKGIILTEAKTSEHMQTLEHLNSKPSLYINEDLTPELDEYIKRLISNGLGSADFTTTVFRTTEILKPPKIFGIHLSRSTFNGVTISRNPCRVSFKEKLNLSLKQDYVDELQRIQEMSCELKPNRPSFQILTTDIEDMEDVSLQREDVDERGYDTETTDVTSETDRESLSSKTSDSSSVSTNGSDSPSLGTENASPGTSDTISEAGKEHSTSSKQATNLSRHFRKFIFEENNVYKYRLVTMIKHIGSHTQGHYECYKKKPLFVKDFSGNILKISPEIDEQVVEEASSFMGKQLRLRKNSQNSSRDSALYEERSGTFRNRISSMMGRRPSISQTDPEFAQPQEILNSGMATPAEVLVNSGDYFSGPSMSELNDSLQKINESGGGKDPEFSSVSRLKMKKIPSLIKNPYWKVGDSQVLEVTKSSVLLETASVYMLYYERVNR